MDLYMTNQHADYPGVWVVADRATGAPVRTFDGDQWVAEQEARTLLASAYDWSALTAAGDQLVAWESDPAIAYIGTPTGDKRQIDEGALSFRSFPQSLMIQFTTDFGHSGSMICGRVDGASIEGAQVISHGVFDSGAAGTEAARLVENQMMTGVSLDPGGATIETEVIEVDEDGWPTDWLDHFTEYVMAGLTLVSVPAFENAAIRVSAAAEGDAGNDDGGADESTGAVAASGVAVDPPVDWFTDPQFDGPTPIRILDDGRIFGHIAVWGTCHIGRSGACVTPPPSSNSYADFATGYVQCEDGCEIPVGVLTMGCGHADLSLNTIETRAHYDNNGTAVARFAIGDDDHGVWIAGSMFPTATAEQINLLRATPPSGDWRKSDQTGQLELVAVLSVNVQGFPVPRTRVEGATQMALVAAVSPRPEHAIDPLVALTRRVDQLFGVVGMLVRDDTVEKLASRI